MNVRGHKFELYFLAALFYRYVPNLHLFLVTQLIDLGGCTNSVGSGWDHILDGVRKVHQFQPASLFLHRKPN